MNYLSFIVAIIICKFASAYRHLKHTGGSYHPGELAIKICPDFLSYASKNTRTILIIGSNGKSTTTRLVSHILTKRGIPNFSNRSGANMTTGIATAFGLNCSLTGQAKAKVAVIECDEHHVESITQTLNPAVIIVTNISEDQTYRLKGVDKVLEIFIDTLSAHKDIPCCLSKDNPHAKILAQSIPHNSINYYSVSSANEITINDSSYQVEWDIPGKYNLENLSAAVSCMNILGIEINDALSSLDGFRLPFGRMEKIRIDDNELTLALIKNLAGAIEVTTTLTSNESTGNLIIYIDYHDAQWFSKSNINSIINTYKNIYICGTGVKRLKPLFHDATKISPEDIITTIKESANPITFIGNYNQMMEVRRQLARLKYVKDFWKD